MQSKDIVVGEDYMAATNKRPFKVTVLKKGVERRTGYYGHAKTDGISTRTDSGTIILTSRQIIQPWAEFQAAQSIRDQAEAKALAAKDTAHRLLWEGIAEVDEVFTGLGVEGHKFWINRRAEIHEFTPDEDGYITLHGVDNRGHVSLDAARLLASRCTDLIEGARR